MNLGAALAGGVPVVAIAGERRVHRLGDADGAADLPEMTARIAVTLEAHQPIGAPKLAELIEESVDDARHALSLLVTAGRIHCVQGRGYSLGAKQLAVDHMPERDTEPQQPIDERTPEPVITPFLEPPPREATMPKRKAADAPAPPAPEKRKYTKRKAAPALKGKARDRVRSVRYTVDDCGGMVIEDGQGQAVKIERADVTRLEAFLEQTKAIRK